MRKISLNFINVCAVVFALSLLCTTTMAMNHLEQYFKFKSEGQNENATKILNEWNPKGSEEKTYKKYFISLNENSVTKYWDLYQELSKKKKLLKLQHESIKKIIELDLEAAKSVTKPLKNFNKVAKKMLGQLRGQPEGLAYELNYLKWILKNKNIKELCTTERSRWLSQTTLNLSEVTLGLSGCSLGFNDFLYRMRLLVFSGEEVKAQEELNEFVEKNKLAEWEKAYLQAVYFSNIGDPTAAFEKISKYEEDLKQNEDYYINLFYISQRAGEQKKAEEIIDNVIRVAKNSKKISEYNYQKAFLFYQTKRYKEAIALLDQIISKHHSSKRKSKSAEYDELTWLRAWCHYLDKNYETAKDYFIENKKWARDKAKNLYWLSQTEWALGNQFSALEYYRQLALPIIEGRFFNYYNYLAWLRFESYKSAAVTELMRNQLSAIRNGKAQFLLPDITTNSNQLADTYESYLAEGDTTDQGAVQLINDENSVANSTETEGIKTTSSEELKNELAWADDLTKWGFRDLAKWHLYEVEKNLKTKSDVVPLIQYYLNNEFYNRAISLMQKVASPNSKKLNLIDEELLWKSMFPKAYEARIDIEAKHQQIQKFLLWSIMKAETQFKTDAISPVGAVGLMQFMPYTSKKVAVLLKENLNSQQLFDSDVAIKYGAAYLKKLSDELGQQLPLIAAAYNGGPHRVKLWMKNLKESDESNLTNDVFIDHIPFNETRTYVKRVINYYLAYQKLYDDKNYFKSSLWLIEKNSFKLKEPFALKEEWPTVK